jgi:hypothetical protein
VFYLQRKEYFRRSGAAVKNNKDDLYTVISINGQEKSIQDIPDILFRKNNLANDDSGPDLLPINWTVIN